MPQNPFFSSPIGMKRKSKLANLPDLETEEMTVMPAKEGFLFGCDPELFVKDDKGRYVSAAGLIPGTKDEPHKVEDGAVQVDGMAAEFNIDPVSDFASWNRKIDSVMKQLAAMLPKGYTLDAVPSVVFDADLFESAPDDAKVLGCNPDFNAWTGEINPPPADPENPYLRTASGHIHFGWTEGAEMDDLQHILNCRDLVKQLDWYLGGWSTRIDTDPTRRRLYGRAGACRFKPYGVEYRVLSNFWITTRDRRLAVWNRMQQAINDMRQGFLPDRMPKTYNYILQESINTTTMDPGLLRNCQFPLRTTDYSYARY